MELCICSLEQKEEGASVKLAIRKAQQYLIRERDRLSIVVPSFTSKPQGEKTAEITCDRIDI